MDDHGLLEIATSLEADSFDSKTHIQPCKPQHVTVLTANRAGLLQLAAACLRAAAEPINTEEGRSKPVKLPQQVNHVVNAESDIVIAFLQRMETWPEPNEEIEARKQRTLRNDKWALLTFGVVGSVILFVLVAGVMAIAGWFR